MLPNPNGDVPLHELGSMRDTTKRFLAMILTSIWYFRFCVYPRCLLSSSRKSRDRKYRSQIPNSNTLREILIAVVHLRNALSFEPGFWGYRDMENVDLRFMALGEQS